PDPAGVEAEQGHPAAAVHDGYPPEEAAGRPLVVLRQPRLRRRGARERLGHRLPTHHPQGPTGQAPWAEARAHERHPQRRHVQRLFRR
ncbi:unnamed protein product, partial [Ectocarpus sp. 12 AP-2014]